MRWTSLHYNDPNPLPKVAAIINEISASPFVEAFHDAVEHLLIGGVLTL